MAVTVAVDTRLKERVLGLAVTVVDPLAAPAVTRPRRTIVCGEVNSISSVWRDAGEWAARGAARGGSTQLTGQTPTVWED